MCSLPTSLSCFCFSFLSACVNLPAVIASLADRNLEARGPSQAQASHHKEVEEIFVIQQTWLFMSCDAISSTV